MPMVDVVAGQLDRSADLLNEAWHEDMSARERLAAAQRLEEISKRLRGCASMMRRMARIEEAAIE
jgi:hypothetical protein